MVTCAHSWYPAHSWCLARATYSYVIPAGHQKNLPKAEHIASVLDELWDARAELQPQPGMTLNAWHQALVRCRGLESFLRGPSAPGGRPAVGASVGVGNAGSRTSALGTRRAAKESDRRLSTVVAVTCRVDRLPAVLTMLTSNGTRVRFGNYKRSLAKPFRRVATAPAKVRRNRSCGPDGSDKVRALKHFPLYDLPRPAASSTVGRIHLRSV